MSAIHLPAFENVDCMFNLFETGLQDPEEPQSSISRIDPEFAADRSSLGERGELIYRTGIIFLDFSDGRTDFFCRMEPYDAKIPGSCNHEVGGI
jgi:hypothetical protein